jgi:hypothetical protein
MQPSLRGMVATCKDHGIGEMSVIAIATSTATLSYRCAPPPPSLPLRRRAAGGGQSGGPADQGKGGGSFGKPDTFCELACLALWRLCMRPMTWPSVASADPSPAGHINDNNPDLLRMPNWVGGGAVGRSYYSILPYPSVRMFLGGGMPAGLVGGRHTQQRSTRTPSPACGRGKQS